MDQDRIAIVIEPTPGTEEIADADLQRLANVIKRPADRIKARIARGQSITLVTPDNPRVPDLINFLRAIGFSVTTSSVSEARRVAAPTRAQTRGYTKKRRHVPEREVSEWHVGDLIENLYEVKDIKRGGMGAVYIVRHTRWNIMMAVKSLLSHLRDSQEDRGLFVKEAETWIDIGFHPNIAACYYVKNILDSPRIFIEYVDSGSFFELIRSRRPLGWDMVIDLMVQVGDGLGHAHAKGLVHRDVKPANCMLTSEGIVKVTDFGLTKRRGDLSRSESGSEVSLTELIVGDSHSVTAAGMGTPSYMAPEMWIAESEVGSPADIYAFGVMFFEMCCARKPFHMKKSEKRDKLIAAHLKEPPPRPRSIRPDLPAALEHTVLKCLEKDPNDRYQSFKEIRDELIEAYEKLFKRSFPRPQPDEVRLAADALNNRAVSLMDLNHQEQAEESLKRAVECDPHHPEAVYNIGLLEWIRTSNPDRGLAVKLEEVVKTPEYRGRGSHLLGRCFLALGDTKRALEAFEVSLQADDASEAWLKHYAIALIGTGREEEAITYLEQYLLTIPSDEEAMGWLIGASVRSGRVEYAAERMGGLPKGSKLVGLSPGAIADSFLISPVDEIMTLAGHRGWVNCMTSFPRSPLVMTGSRDRSLKIWDLETGKAVNSIAVVGEPPSALWISPDERLVVVAADKAGIPLRILDLEMGRFVGNLPGHSGLVTAVCFSPDAKQIVTVEEKGVVRFWDAEIFRATETFKIPVHTAADAVFEGSSGPEIFVACQDRTIKRISPIGSEALSFVRTAEERILSLRVSPQGAIVVTGARDKSAISWDGRKGQQMAVCRAHEDQVTSVAVNLRRDLVASYDPKAGIKLWDARTGMVLRTFDPGSGEIHCLEFTLDGDRLMAGGREMFVKVWDVRGRTVLPDMALAKIRSVTKQMVSDRQFKSMLESAKKSMARGAFSKAYTLARKAQSLPGYERSDGPLDLIFRLKDKGKRVDLRGGWKRRSFETPSSVMDVTFSPSAITFITAQSDHTIRVYSTKKGECLNILKGHTNLVAGLDFAPNGREAVSGSDDRTVRIWELASGKNSSVFKGHSDSVSSVAYSHDGHMVLSASWDGTAKLWELSDGHLVKTFRSHEDKLAAAAFTKDLSVVITGGFDGLAKVWETSSGRLLRDLRGHKDRITSISVSPTNRLCVTGSMDGTIRFWSMGSASELAVLEVDQGGVRTVDFSDDGEFLLTGGSDTVLRIWDVNTGKCLRDFQGHSKEITAARFSLNGRYAISSSADGVVMVWELDWDWDFPDQRAAQPPGDQE